MPNDLSNVHKVPWSFLYLFSIRVFKFPNMECKLEMFESFTFNSHTFSFFFWWIYHSFISWNFKLAFVLVFLWLVQGLIVSLKLKLQYFISLKKTKVIAITRLHHEGFYEHMFNLKFLIQFLNWLHQKKNLFLLAQGFHDIFSWYWIFLSNFF